MTRAERIDDVLDKLRHTSGEFVVYPTLRREDALTLLTAFVEDEVRRETEQLQTEYDNLRARHHGLMQETFQKDGRYRWSAEIREFKRELARETETLRGLLRDVRPLLDDSASSATLGVIDAALKGTE